MEVSHRKCFELLPFFLFSSSCRLRNACTAADSTPLTFGTFLGGPTAKLYLFCKEQRNMSEKLRNVKILKVFKTDELHNSHVLDFRQGWYRINTHKFPLKQSCDGYTELPAVLWFMLRSNRPHIFGMNLRARNSPSCLCYWLTANYLLHPKNIIFRMGPAWALPELQLDCTSGDTLERGHISRLEIPYPRLKDPSLPKVERSLTYNRSSVTDSMLN